VIENQLLREGRKESPFLRLDWHALRNDAEGWKPLNILSTAKPSEAAPASADAVSRQRCGRRDAGRRSATT